MVKQLIKLYRKTQMELIGQIADDENFFMHEVDFFDDGRSASAVKEFQEHLKEIDTEYKFVDETNGGQDKLNFLNEKRYEYIRAMLVISSQNFKNIERCIGLYGENRDDFYPCLLALKYYKDNKHDEAFKLLQDNFKSGRDYSKHYLLNKIYGMMLYSRGYHSEAHIRLYLAVQAYPEDVEIHKKLYELYSINGNEYAKSVEKDIISLLSGEKL